MAQTSLLPKIKITDAVGKKSYIPLEHNVYATQRVGKIVPYMCKYVDANGKHKIDLETLNYMSPMIAPTVGDIRLKHWLYWIPFSRLSENLGNMFAKQKAVKYDGSEFDVTKVPNISLAYLSTLCLIGSFCTLYLKDHKKAPAGAIGVMPWQDGKTYLFPSNYKSNGESVGLHDIEAIWNNFTSGDFINTGTVASGDQGKTVLAQYASRLLGGMTSWCINAKYLYPANDIVQNSANQYHIDIPLANPSSESFLDWRTSSGKIMYDGTHLESTHGIDCTPVSLENPDYCVNRSFTYTDSDSIEHDVTVTFAFRFSDFGRALRDNIIASGDQLDLSSSKKVSFLPFISIYLAYFYAQPLVKYKNWQNTAAYKIMTRFTTANVVDLGANMTNLHTNNTDANLFVEFINDLASMWAIEPQDYVSAHTREPFTSPLAFNSLDSFINGVSEDVADQTNPAAVPISQINSSSEPNGVERNNQPYINNINHDVTTASLLQRIALRMAVNSVIGRPVRKLLRSMGYGDWLDNCAPQMVDYGELRLNLKPVVSTSDTSTSDGRGADLGQLGGRGFGHNYHKSKPFANKEPGYFVLLTTVYVNSGYCQSIDASNFCIEPDDFYKRDFDACGFEIDEKNQVHGSLTWVEEGDTDKLNESFGYIPRSTKFKTISNKLLGDFTDGEKFDVYSPYHLEKLLPVGKRSINAQKELELVQGYKFTGVQLGSRFAPADVPIAGNIWRYLGRFPWLGQFDRIFKLYDYDLRKIQGVFGLESENFFELVSKIYSYFIATPENYVFLNTIHYDSWQDKKPISESFGTLSEIFNGGANATEVKA